MQSWAVKYIGEVCTDSGDTVHRQPGSKIRGMRKNEREREAKMRNGFNKRV